MAIYQPFFNPTDYKNLPSTSTPLNQTNLNNTENGVKELDFRTVHLSEDKAENALVNMLVKDVSVNTKDGVITVTLQNGTTKTYDLDIEKVVSNFDLDDENNLVLVLADGTTKTIDMTRFVNSFASSATISMHVVNRVVTATIVDGSVTMEKLDAAIQTEFRQYMLDTQAARDAALQYSKIAKRYSEGDTEFEGSDTDNAKYYYLQSQTNAQTSTQKAQIAVENAEVATTQAAISTQKSTQATLSANNASASELSAKTSAENAKKSENVSSEKAEIATEKVNVAVEKATESKNSAILSKRYSEGDVLFEGSDTDNAKYYYEETKTLKEQVDAVSKIVVPRFYIDFTTGKLMSDKAANGIRFWIENGKLYGEVTA